MKKLVVAIAVGMVALGAMAQGRVVFANDSTRVVFWDSTKTAISAAEATAAGLVANLYVGTTASVDSMVLGLTRNTWSGNAGQWTSLTGNLPAGFPGATPLFFQVRVTSTGFVGVSQVFSAVASTSAISGNSLVLTTTPSFSTWLPGTQAVTGAAAGALGAIAVVPVPEPTSFALAGLGAAALLIFRRRN